MTAVIEPSAPVVRRRWSLALLGITLALAAVWLGQLRPGGGSARPGTEPALERAAEVSAYEEALAGPLHDGGFVVAEGMRPGVADILEGRYPDDVLATMAQGWLASMRMVRTDLAAIDVPPGLAGVARAYDEAVAAYIETAELLAAATGAAGPERRALIDEAIAAGNAADAAFDAAADQLSRHRAAISDRSQEGTP